MDNFEYLNQISQSVRPAKSASSSLRPIIMIVVGGIIVFFLLMIIGIALNSQDNGPIELTKQLYTRAANLKNTVGAYNGLVKSPRLRSIGTSLSGAITNTNAQLTNYLTSKQADENALVPNASTIEAETTIKNELNITLQNARLNGILDRIYLNQITLQVSLLISLESEILSKTNDEELIDILTQSQSSFSTILSSLETFSDHSS